MYFQNSVFLRSAMSPSQFFTDRPEIVFCGRSNVGKSTLLNALTGRKALARTSSMPGKTAAVNYFLIDNSFYLVDLPGYGYARVSDGERRRWDKLMQQYFTDNIRKKLAVLLVDLRHPPTALDEQMAQMLCECNIPFVVVGTKSDKLSTTMVQQQTKQLEQFAQQYQVDALALSGMKKTGVEQLRNYIENVMQ